MERMCMRETSNRVQQNDEYPREIGRGRSREEEQEEMDTPGIEPGAFRLQSGRATTALCAQQISTLPHQFTLPRTAPYHTFSSSQNLRLSHIATPLTNRSALLSLGLDLGGTRPLPPFLSTRRTV